MQNIHDIKVFACVVGVAISALLIYGLNRQWRWLIDPTRMDVCLLLSRDR